MSLFTKKKISVLPKIIVFGSALESSQKVFAEPKAKGDTYTTATRQRLTFGPTHTDIGDDGA